MPKLKSHRGAAKRFKKTSKGKFLRPKAFKRHILTSKPTRRKRHMRSRLSEATGASAEVATLREEREVIRNRVVQMIAQIDKLNL